MSISSSISGTTSQDANDVCLLPAALNGVVGVKPSYEVVSKLGLVACVSSMECIGAIAKDVKTTADVLAVISENQISNEICEDVAGL